MSKFDSDLELATTESVKSKIKSLLKVSFHAVAIAGLVFVFVAEVFPEEIAKPLVVAAVLLNLGYHGWSWRKIRMIHR